MDLDSLPECKMLTDLRHFLKLYEAEDTEFEIMEFLTDECRCELRWGGRGSGVSVAWFHLYTRERWIPYEPEIAWDLQWITADWSMSSKVYATGPIKLVNDFKDFLNEWRK